MTFLLQALVKGRLDKGYYKMFFVILFIGCSHPTLDGRVGPISDELTSVTAGFYGKGVP